MTTPADKSPGHICFANDFEFFEREGEVYRAKITDPLCNLVQVSGKRVESRHGRWECSRPYFDRYRKVLTGEVERDADPVLSTYCIACREVVPCECPRPDDIASDWDRAIREDGHRDYTPSAMDFDAWEGR
jgi:hypothetical protein